MSKCINKRTESKRSPPLSETNPFGDYFTCQALFWAQEGEGSGQFSAFMVLPVLSGGTIMQVIILISVYIAMIYHPNEDL